MHLLSYNLDRGAYFMNNFEMTDLYYERINFFQNKSTKMQQITLTVNHKYEFQKSNDQKNIKLVVRTTIKDKEGRVTFELDTIAIFSVNYDPDLNNIKIQRDLVSQAWPYVRQEVQLITTQPGIMPIILPINPHLKEAESQDMYA